MRCSVLIASNLAVGILAMPQLHRRRIVTQTELVFVTEIVYVTEGYVEPTSTSLATSTASTASTTAAKQTLSTVVSSTTPAPHSSSSSKATPSPTTAPAANRLADPSSFEFLHTARPSSSSTPKPQTKLPPSSSNIPSSSSKTAPAAKPTVVAKLDHLSGADQAYLSAGPEYQAAVLYHHNAARANHDAAPLAWDSDCEANARIAAKKCTFQHYIPDGAGQGQNLFTVSGDAFNVTAGITTSWYQGELEPMMPYFGRDDIPDDVFHSVGHLTQLVWKATTKVGCVSLNCGSSMIVGGSTSSMNKYTVCNYAPAGNIGGEYAANVAAPNSITNLGGWAN